AAAGCAAGTNQWTGATSNQWNVASNWSTGVIPVAADNVCIGSAFSNSTITIGSLAAANQTIANPNSHAALNFIAGPLTLTGAANFLSTLSASAGNLTLSSGGQATAVNFTGSTITTNGALNITGAASMSGGTLTGSGNINVGGLFTWTGGQLVGTATPNAVFNANGGIDFNGALPNGINHQVTQRTLNLPVGTFTLSGQSALISMSNG